MSVYEKNQKPISKCVLLPSMNIHQILRLINLNSFLEPAYEWCHG